MITIMRRYFRTSSQVILWLIIAAFIIGLMPMAIRQASEASLWAIRVDGEDIGYQEFLLERERQRERILAFREQYGEYADFFLSLMGAADPQQLAIRALVKQELLNQFADKLGIHIGDEFIAKKLNDPAFIQAELADIVPLQLVDPSTGINEKMLERYLKRIGFSVDLFERQIERTLVDTLVTQIIAATAYVPRFDIEQKIFADYAKKSFSILKFSIEPLLNQEKKKEVSNTALMAFYEDHNAKSKRYMVPEKRAGMMWEFSPKAYNIAITDAQIEKYYEDNKNKKYVDTPATIEVRRILLAVPDQAKRIETQEKAIRMRDELRQDPSKFIALAQRSSDDKETAASGGLLKPFVRGSQEQSFDRAAFLLQHDGDLSDVIETSRGFEILQRVSKKPQTFKPLSVVKQDIKNTLYEHAFQKQFIADMKAIGDQEGQFVSFVQQKGGVAKNIEPMAQDSSLIAQHLFKVSPGQKAFFIDGNKGVVVRLDTLQEKHTPSLATIKEVVLQDYYLQEAQQALKQKLHKAKSLIGKQSMKELQRAMGGDIIETGWVASDDKDAFESLKNKGIPVNKMLQIEKVGGIVTDLADGRGILMRLDEIEPVDTAKSKENYAQKVREIEQRRQQEYLEGFVASLYRNATIETNESVVTFQA
jgi:hypothetical protein